VPDPVVRALFDPLPGRTYLDAATYGLPPRPTVDAMERALEGWRNGPARWVDDWDRPTESVRAAFVCVPIDRPEPVRASLEAAGIRAAIKATPSGSRSKYGTTRRTSTSLPRRSARTSEPSPE
jgi:hypothetical protein